MSALPPPTWRSECGRASLYVGDALDVLRSLPDGLVQCVVTSPPYWGLRDYSVDGQIGLEATPDKYVAKMVEVFAEVRRVLRDDGTLWCNLGDSYAHSGACGGSSPDGPRKPRATDAAKQKAMSYKVPPGLKSKDLCGIPWRVALALQADGWYLRQDIIWYKSNPMPESCTDRCTKSHEYIFLLTKRAKYYFDAEAIKEPAIYAGQPRGGSTNRYEQNAAGMDNREYDTRNKRSVWTVQTCAYPDAHFATYPPALIEPCIMAGAAAKCCAECGTPHERMIEKVKVGDWSSRERAAQGVHQADKGLKGNDYYEHYVPPKTVGWQPACKCGTTETQASIVLDPFAGSGTTMHVAHKHGCRSIGIELNPEYAELIIKRIDQELRQGRMFP